MLRRDSTLASLARPIYRRLRTAYLRRRYPSGHFVSGTGVPVFCDFADPSYVWYDADSDYLRFHKAVFEALIDRSVGEVFIDIGAHYGFYSAFIAAAIKRRGRRARIICVEPDRRHSRCLERTVGPLNGDRVTLEVVSAAIGDCDGAVMLYRSAASCLHSYREVGAVPCYEVQTVTLDSLVRNRLEGDECVAMIKIDVDGAEPFVMEGWHDTIRQHRPIILTEFSPVAVSTAGRDPRVLFEKLCDGFSVTHINHYSTRLEPVTREDYERIARQVGDGVTDLILSPGSLSVLDLPLCD